MVKKSKFGEMQFITDYSHFLWQGIADVASERGGTRYEFLEISNPVDLLVRGEKQDVNMDDCKGLARLQAM